MGVKSIKESDGSWTWSLPDKATEGGQAPTIGTLVLAPLALLALLTRMPSPRPTIPLIYGKGAKEAKRAKGTICSAASTTSLAG
jgi:hypothetical protein